MDCCCDLDRRKKVELWERDYGRWRQELVRNVIGCMTRFPYFRRGHDGRRPLGVAVSDEQRHCEQLNLSSISTHSHTPSPYVLLLSCSSTIH
jgi:hypothetical protein